MALTDTHTHIFLEEFDEDREKVIERALQAGVERFFLPNIDLETIERLHRTADAYPDICFPMMGLHPTSVGSDWQRDLDHIRKLFDQRKYIAVGEIGIDLYWDKTFRTEQIAAFETQLRWSLELDLPVAIHTRNAFPEVFESISKIGATALKGIFHSFGGTREELETALAFPNFCLGINGTVTFKNARFAEYLSIAPIERIVLETDAPYLAPAPNRGKRNEPSFLPLVAQKVAEIYGLDKADVGILTNCFTQRFF